MNLEAKFSDRLPCSFQADSASWMVQLVAACVHARRQLHPVPDFYKKKELDTMSRRRQNYRALCVKPFLAN